MEERKAGVTIEGGGMLSYASVLALELTEVVEKMSDQKDGGVIALVSRLSSGSGEGYNH